MKTLLKLVTFFLIIVSFETNSFAVIFAPFEPCEINEKDENIYIKKFKDTKLNEINFIQKDYGCEIEIKSDNSGSMLVRKAGLKTEKYKFINFDFKVLNIISAANLKEKKGDDAPARIYVFFEYEQNKAGFLEKMYRKYSKNEYDGKAIVYVWGSNTKNEEVIENPYSDMFIQIIVESGAGNQGKYISFKRNVFEDFKKYFKQEPPEKISSIAIMTDTDNTGSKATGYFKNIYLSTE
jgi:hypothetical protein